MIAAHDFLVDYRGDPETLDRTLQALGPAVLLQGPVVPDEYIQCEGYYVMRVFGDPGFIKFACERQGYCTIIRELEHLV
jgi:hypothetical protein